MASYFSNEDFSAFDPTYAASEDNKIIANRHLVARNKIIPLHNGVGTGQGLKDFLRTHELYPHWQKQHLTNVLYPLPVANGGYVDYVRLGYGKKRAHVTELARRSGVFKEVTQTGTTDLVAFYAVAQLQVGLNYNSWWINFYIDKKGWLEQYNLLNKIAQDPGIRTNLLNIVDYLVSDGYKLYINRYDGTWLPAEYYPNADLLLKAMEKYKQTHEAYSLSIEKSHAPKDGNNQVSKINDYIIEEFNKLLPLYKFCAWHPINNNYLW